LNQAHKIARMPSQGVTVRPAVINFERGVVIVARDLTRFGSRDSGGGAPTSAGMVMPHCFF
jgi:hypothetical protein